MRIGVITNGWSAEDFDGVAKQKLPFVEFCCNNERESDALCGSLDSILASKERTGIDVSSVGRWNHDVMANGTVLPEKKEKYFALLDAAIALGAKSFVCGANYDTSISLYKNYANAISFFRDLIERADGRINIAIQNCNWNNYIVTPKQWEVVLGELPELGLKYDPSHAYSRGANYLEELSDWGDRIAHFHVKGIVRAGQRAIDDPPAGMDDLRWGAIFAILYARGYDGDLSIEPHSKTWRGERGNAGILYTKDYISKFIV